VPLFNCQSIFLRQRFSLEEFEELIKAAVAIAAGTRALAALRKHSRRQTSDEFVVCDITANRTFFRLIQSNDDTRKITEIAAQP
jgi:hypothetical protein